jgi:hypothetical protein
VSASRSCFSLGCPPRRGPQPPAVPVGSHSGVACRTCASEVRSTFLRACMRDDRRTDHRLISSQTLEADGSASRDAVARQSGPGTCRVLISSKFLLKNLAPPGVRPGFSDENGRKRTKKPHFYFCFYICWRKRDRVREWNRDMRVHRNEPIRSEI